MKMTDTSESTADRPRDWDPEDGPWSPPCPTCHAVGGHMHPCPCSECDGSGCPNCVDPDGGPGASGHGEPPLPEEGDTEGPR